MNKLFKNAKGFTLLEILVALFVFTILSVILASALHNVINFHSRTEMHAKRLRELQMALLMLSRDIEQAVNRPVLIASGAKEAAFIGTAKGFTLTHVGFANPMATALQSNLQRTKYEGSQQSLWRITWDVLDAAPGSLASSRCVLTDVYDVHFKYLDKDNHFHDEWPVVGQSDQPLPRAIRVFLTIANWGKLSELYVIPTSSNKDAKS